MTLNMQAAEYRDGEVSLTGIFVCDQTKTQKCPGILVVHGGAGLDDHAKGRARRLSELGYVVFACNLYGNGVAGDRQRVMATLMDLRKDVGKLRQRAYAGLEMLKSHPLVDGRLAAVGYCFGGTTVLELARSGADVLGVVSVHGSLDTSQPNTAKAKILVCHGALDPHVPMSKVNAFTDEMNGAGTDFQLIIYGGAMHGFTHEAGPAMPGVAYHALADARSGNAIQGFLAELFEVGEE